jgi:hypothetical protein
MDETKSHDPKGRPMTPNPRPAEGRTSPQETKLAGNGETVADEAVERAAAGYWNAHLHDADNAPEPWESAIKHGAWMDGQSLVASCRRRARAALEAAGYFALRDERDALSTQIRVMDDVADKLLAERDALRERVGRLATHWSTVDGGGSEAQGWIRSCGDVLQRILSTPPSAPRGEASITVAQVREWLKTRPGVSWNATIVDIDAAVAAIAASAESAGDGA